MSRPGEGCGCWLGEPGDDGVDGRLLLLLVLLVVAVRLREVRTPT